MRSVISKSDLKPGRFLSFFYRSSLGKPILSLLTLRPLSKIAGAYLDSGLSRCLIKGYAKRNNIDLAQYEPGPFKSFNAFFTRRILPELRPVDSDPSALISPCDGKLSLYQINEDCRFEIKGFTYDVETLIGDTELAKKYDDEKSYSFVNGVLNALATEYAGK